MNQLEFFDLGPPQPSKGGAPAATGAIAKSKVLTSQFTTSAPQSQPPSKRSRVRETSRKAYASAQRRGPSSRTRVYDFLCTRGQHGATDHEMQSALGLRPETQRGARGNLVDRGLVADSGATRPTSSGCQATVWAVRHRAQDPQGQGVQR